MRPRLAAGSLRRAVAGAPLVGVALTLAMTSCAAALHVDLAGVPLGVQQPFSDEGSSGDRAAVRAALQDALTAQEDQLSRMPDGTPRSTAAARAARLRTVEDPRLAADDLAAMRLLTSRDVPFRSARFAVERWQGVVVRGGRARVQALGHDVLTGWDGSRRRDPSFQYGALLRRDPRAPHGWVLLLVRAASDEQG